MKSQQIRPFLHQLPCEIVNIWSCRWQPGRAIASNFAPPPPDVHVECLPMNGKDVQNSPTAAFRDVGLCCREKSTPHSLASHLQGREEGGHGAESVGGYFEGWCEDPPELVVFINNPHRNMANNPARFARHPRRLIGCAKHEIGNWHG